VIVLGIDKSQRDITHQSLQVHFEVFSLWR